MGMWPVFNLQGLEMKENWLNDMITLVMPCMCGSIVTVREGGISLVGNQHVKLYCNPQGAYYSDIYTQNIKKI